MGPEKTLQSLCPHVKLKWVTDFKLLGIKFSIDLGKMEAINFNCKLAEIENLLNMYQRRKISIIGKVAIIKSLAIPKLIHLFTVLPTPSKKNNRKIREYIQEIYMEQ